MTTEKQKDMARETYRKLSAELARKNPNVKIRHPDKDPKPLPKGEPGRVHLQILPGKAQMRPGGFWREGKCYYEILVGHCKTAPRLSLGAVQFFRYANQVS